MNATGEYVITSSDDEIVFSRDDKDAQLFYSRSKANAIMSEAIDLITHSRPALEVYSCRIVTVKAQHKVGKNILI